MSTDVTIESVVNLHKDGLSERMIARQLGTTRSMVRRRLMESRASSARVIDRPDTGNLLGSAAEVWAEAAKQSSQLVTGIHDIGVDHVFDFGLDGRSWRQFGQKLTIPALASMSPSISRAVWDYLRLLDPGHEVKVFKPGTDEVDDEAQSVLDKFIEDRIDPYYSSLTGLIQQLNMGTLYRGALCAQLLTDPTGTTPYGVLAPDPDLVEFKSRPDEYMGRIWEPGVKIDGEWTSVKSPYFYYVPFDPQPSSPYGRSIIGSSAFPSMFLLGLLYDLRRVVAQQGYPNKDITVLTSKLRETFADQDDDTFKAIIEDFVAEVSRAYGALEPDSAFVHTDAVQVGQAEGAVDSNVIGGSKSLLDMLERLEVRALKTMPILMGLTDGVSEANANRQWEIFVQGVKHMQHFCENVLEGIFGHVLRLKGKQGDVEVRFAEIRSAEILRDEQTKTAKFANLIVARDQGWITNDEASEEAVGHKSVDTEAEEASEIDVPAAEDMSEPEDDGGPEDVGPEGASASPLKRLTMTRATGMNLIVSSWLQVDDGVIENVKSAWRRVFSGKMEELLLDALVIGTREEAKGRKDSRWFWVEETREFVTAYGARRDAIAVRELLYKFRRQLEREVDALGASAFGLGESVAWQSVRDMLIAGALAGHGGSESMGRRADGVISDALAEQYGFWEDFIEETKATEVEDPEAAEETRGWRWPLYLAAGLYMYYSSRSEEWGIKLEEVPPRHPNCDCFLEFGEDSDGPWVTWQTVGENCPECDRLAETYVKFRGV